MYMYIIIFTTDITSLNSYYCKIQVITTVLIVIQTLFQGQGAYIRESSYPQALLIGGTFLSEELYCSVLTCFFYKQNFKVENGKKLINQLSNTSRLHVCYLKITHFLHALFYHILEAVEEIIEHILTQKDMNRPECRLRNRYTNIQYN